MTAPVLTFEQQGSLYIQFILPSKYQSISDCPKPSRTEVELIELKERVFAVRTFSGTWNYD